MGQGAEVKMQLEGHRRLLQRAEVLYERHGGGSQVGEDFNVFSVLRTESDEVNLHSRFLAALLRHRKSVGERAHNLEDFLSTVAGARDLDVDGAQVEREHHNIDILILDRSSSRAVVVENKIWAGDQHRQLTRYAEKMEREGVGRIDLLYLTLDGHKPEEHSIGGRQVRCVSYKDELLPWLERCQERAYDEPALRESTAQYVSLIRKLVGVDVRGEYMSELKDLILKDNNLLLVHDLNEAMIDARVSLLEKLWMEMDSELRSRIPDLPKKTSDSDITRETIRHFLTKKNYVYHGLYYTLGEGSTLAVEVERYMYFGVHCSVQDFKSEHRRLRKLLADLEGNADLNNEWWPWYQWAPGDIDLRQPNRQHLALLSDDRERRKHVEEIAIRLRRVWEWIKAESN